MKSLIIEAGIPTAAGRRALLLGCALAIGLLTVGCRLFGGGEELAEVHGPADYQPTDISDDWTDEDLVAPGSDAPIQGPRPGQLLPFPELRTIYFDYDRSEIRLDQTDNIDHNLQYILDHSEERSTSPVTVTSGGPSNITLPWAGAGPTPSRTTSSATASMPTGSRWSAEARSSRRLWGTATRPGPRTAAASSNGCTKTPARFFP